VSGLSGLLYEVTWTRVLVLVMGSTVFSVTTVLTSFMGGLALGSFLGGRVADRLRRPVRAYGLLEAAIGAFGLAVPWLVRALKPLYAAAYGAVGDSAIAFGFCQFVLAGLVILVPSTLMGATLPILSRPAVRSIARVGRSVGGLYAVNTFGAVAGALLAGFALVPFLGIVGTTLTAAALNVAIAAIALALDRGMPAEAPPPAAAGAEARAPAAGGPDRAAAVPLAPLLAAFAAAGFASMVDQVAWTRVLSLVLGSSVYAFSLMVGAFILGLALGGAVFAAVADRLKSPARTFAATQALAAAATAALLPVFVALPRVILSIARSESRSFLAAEAVRFGLVFACLLVPTALMGAAFPLVTKIAARRKEEVGRTVGAAYASNTLGAIAGAFLAGFVLVPALGLRWSLLLASTLNLATAALVLFGVARPLGERVLSPRSLVPKALGALAILLAATVVRWDAAKLSSGAYLYGVRSRDERLGPGTDSDGSLLDWGELLFYEEGMTATVSVRRAEDGTIALQTNGKTDASTSSDMRTQVLLAHVPVALAGGRERALVIGLGSGVTAGSIGRYPFEAIDCVEISAEIVTAAKRFFGEANGGILDDRRLRLVVGDARTFVDLEDATYDVITSEPSNLWIAGIANLFSREFFAMCRDRLRPGGVMGQWLHAYDLRPEDFRTVVRTFVGAFPEASLFELGRGADYLLVGSSEPQSFDLDRLRARLAEKEVAADLGRIAIHDAGDLLGTFVAGTGALRRFAGEGPVNTDDNGLLEYAAPRTLHRRQSDANLAALAPVFEPIGPYLLGAEESRAEVGAEVGRRRAAREIVLEVHRLAAEGKTEEAMARLRVALEDLPDDLDMIRTYSAYEMTRAERSIESGDLDDAVERAKRVLALDPDNVDALNVRAHGLLGEKRPLEAVGLFERVHVLRPKSADTVLNLSTAYIEAGRPDDAIRVIDELARGGTALGADLYFNRGTAHSRKGDHAAAARDYQSALRIRPDESTRAALEAARAALGD